MDWKNVNLFDRNGSINIGYFGKLLNMIAGVVPRVNDTGRILEDGLNQQYIQESMSFQIWF